MTRRSISSRFRCPTGRRSNPSNFSAFEKARGRVPQCSRVRRARGGHCAGCSRRNSHSDFHVTGAALRFGLVSRSNRHTEHFSARCTFKHRSSKRSHCPFFFPDLVRFDSHRTIVDLAVGSMRGSGTHLARFRRVVTEDRANHFDPPIGDGPGSLHPRFLRFPSNLEKEYL